MVQALAVVKLQRQLSAEAEELADARATCGETLHFALPLLRFHLLKHGRFSPAAWPRRSWPMLSKFSGQVRGRSRSRHADLPGPGCFAHGKRAGTFPVNAVVRETIMERQVHFQSND